MNIVRNPRHRTKHPVPSWPEIRDTARTGPAADGHYEGGPTMSLAEIAALEPAEWEHRTTSLARAYDPFGIPPGFQVCPVDLSAVAAGRATVDENLTAIEDALSGLPMHTIRMLLMPYAARIVELLDGPAVAERTAGISPLSERRHAGISMGGVL